jgi:hypothetical protein
MSSWQDSVAEIILSLQLTPQMCSLTDISVSHARDPASSAMPLGRCYLPIPICEVLFANTNL